MSGAIPAASRDWQETLNFQPPERSRSLTFWLLRTMALASLTLDVLCYMFAFLGTPDVQCYSSTNRALYGYYVSAAARLFDPRAMLAEFFAYPDDFRVLQSLTGVVISGSQALQFLSRRSIGARVLDLYVHYRSAYVVIIWLELNGYTLIRRHRSCVRFVDHDQSDDDFYDAVSGSAYNLRPGQLLLTFVAHYNDRKIDLIVSTDNALSSIIGFHSSAVMNFIAADCAVSLFPHATFVETLSLLFERHNDCDDNVILKYSARGLTFYRHASVSFVFEPGYRWIGHHDEPAATHGYARNCWIQRLPPVLVTARSQLFWSLGQRFHPSVVCVQICEKDDTYWPLNGWEIKVLDSARALVSLDYYPFKDGDVRPYCVPRAFCRHLMDSLRDSRPGNYGSWLPEGTERLSLWIREFMKDCRAGRL